MSDQRNIDPLSYAWTWMYTHLITMLLSHSIYSMLKCCFRRKENELWINDSWRWLMCDIVNVVPYSCPHRCFRAHIRLWWQRKRSSCADYEWSEALIIRCEYMSMDWIHFNEEIYNSNGNIEECSRCTTYIASIGTLAEASLCKS